MIKKCPAHTRYLYLSENKTIFAIIRDNVVRNCQLFVIQNYLLLEYKLDSWRYASLGSVCCGVSHTRDADQEASYKDNPFFRFDLGTRYDREEDISYRITSSKKTIISTPLQHRQACKEKQ
jgi:hypothetical protein